MRMYSAIFLYICDILTNHGLTHPIYPSDLGESLTHLIPKLMFLLIDATDLISKLSSLQHARCRQSAGMHDTAF